MTNRELIFWMRVKLNVRHNVTRAIELLLSIGATLAQAVRYVAVARSA